MHANYLGAEACDVARIEAGSKGRILICWHPAKLLLIVAPVAHLPVRSRGCHDPIQLVLHLTNVETILSSLQVVRVHFERQCPHPQL